MKGRFEGRAQPGAAIFHPLLARYRRIDPLVRFMIAHWALGAATGVVCAALLLAIDPFGLRQLIAGSDAAALAVALLTFGFASTFGGLVCAAAVMFPDGYFARDREPPRGLKAPAVLRLALARAGARR